MPLPALGAKYLGMVQGPYFDRLWLVDPSCLALPYDPLIPAAGTAPCPPFLDCRQSLEELVGVSETSIHESMAAAHGSGHWGAGSGAWAAGMDRQEALIQGLQVGAG